MKQIVPQQIWADIALKRGEEVICDVDLYHAILEKHFLEPFETFCQKEKLPKLEQGTRQRRDAINRFAKLKPKFVVERGRLFTYSFLSELEIRIDELSPEEVAHLLNLFLRRPRLIEVIKGWFGRD